MKFCSFLAVFFLFGKAICSANTGPPPVPVLGELAGISLQRAYSRTIVVSPVGTPLQNGARLLRVVAGITRASASNPWLIKVEPGHYDLGGFLLAMKPYVDVEGSGALVTTIASSHSAHVFAVLGADASEMRSLTIRASSDGHNFAVGYAIQSSSVARLTDVTVLATVTGSAGAATGVWVDSGSNLTMSRVKVRAEAPNGTSAALLCTNSAVLVEGSDLGAAGEGSESNGVRSNASSITMNGSRVSATGAANNLGINSYGGGTVIVDASQITASSHTIRGTEEIDTIRVGASKLIGGPVVGGTTTCAGVYDESYRFFPDTCP